MARYVDFQKIKARVPIEAIVAHYSLPLEETESGQLVGDCPFCGDGDADAERLKVTPDKNAWKCWNCGKHGNNLDLVTLLEDMSLPKAAIHLAEAFEITDCELDPHSRRKKTPKANRQAVAKVATPKKHQAGAGDKTEAGRPTLRHNPPLEWAGLKNLDPADESLANIYIWLPEIATDFESGLCSRGMMKGRFAVPIHNIDGELLAYCGIDLEEHSASRLKFPPADKYDPSLDLFNLHRAIKDPLYIETGVLDIVQDIIEAFTACDGGHKNVVATMRGVPTEQQILRLRSLDPVPRAFSISWRRPSKELEQSIAKLSEFAWVRVRYA